jgi:hypothetical protein
VQLSDFKPKHPSNYWPAQRDRRPRAVAIKGAETVPAILTYINPVKVTRAHRYAALQAVAPGLDKSFAESWLDTGLCKTDPETVIVVRVAQAIADAEERAGSSRMAQAWAEGYEAGINVTAHEPDPLNPYTLYPKQER